MGKVVFIVLAVVAIVGVALWRGYSLDALREDAVSVAQAGGAEMRRIADDMAEVVSADEPYIPIESMQYRPQTYDEAYIAEGILRRLNERREAAGISPLLADPALDAIAASHSSELARRSVLPVNHRNAAGQDPTGRARAAGYECVKPTTIGIAENAHVVFTHDNQLPADELADRAVADWLDSAGHRRNIMDRRYSRSGIGIAWGHYMGFSGGMFIVHKFC